MIDQLLAALTLLTRLPAGRLVRGAWPDPAACVWAYPLVGILVGSLGATALRLLHAAGMPALPAAILALTAILLLTGALHEDGLADTADGFGGGGTMTKKLEIMRDSRIGSYGALALIASFSLRAAALASLSPMLATAALLAAGGLSRGAILIVLLRLPPARPDGHAAALAAMRSRIAAVGLLIAAGSAIALPPTVAITGIAAVALTALALSELARRQIGGHTGDILGAAAVAGECALLSVVACA